MTDVNEEARELAGPHYEGEDAWFSCPKSEEGCADESAGEGCHCGVDKRAARIATALAAAEKRGELKGARARTKSAWDVAQDSVMRLDAVACFTCKAKPDEPCWDTVRNGPASGTHLTRIADALKKFRDAHLAEIEERSATDKPSRAR